MDEKICLDTDVCIEILKGNNNFNHLLEKDEIPFITSITIFELLLRKTNLDKLDILFSKVNFLDFDYLSAKNASNVYKELEEAGTILDYRDVFIAAICVINNCKLATLNKKHFSRIKNLKLI